MLRTLSFLLSLILLGKAFTGCDNAPAREEQMSGATRDAPVVETITLREDSLVAQLTIPGELLAYQQVDLYAKVTGFVEELKVDIGSRVKAGQILMTLEAPEIMSQLSAAQSRLRSQEALYTASLANYNRLVETSKTPGTISQNELEQAEAKKSSELANLQAARANIREVTEIRRYLVIRAPFGGTITARNVNIGAYVGPSGKGSEFPVLTLQQQSRLRLVIAVPESYSGYLKQGDEISFTVRSMPSEIFKAKLTRLSGALDERLRSQRAEADIDNGEGRFLAGTVADVTASLRSSPGSYIIPKSALVTSAEHIFVIKVVNGKAQRVNVRSGLESNDLVAVTGALAPGDVLVKKATDEIKDGQDI